MHYKQNIDKTLMLSHVEKSRSIHGFQVLYTHNTLRTNINVENVEM